MNIDNDTRVALARAVIDGPAVTFDGPRFDPKLYKKVNAVLESLGGAWSRKAQVHAFAADVDVGELLAGAIAAGKVVTVREAQQALGWFPTPDPLADQLVAWADIGPTSVVLEPSAGEGAIVRAVRRAQPDATVICIEREPGRREALRDLPVLIVEADDFLDVNLGGEVQVDRAVMNPAFCKSGKGDHLDHVRHAFAMLVPGGRLVSVLPSSITFREDRRHRETRAWIEEHGELIKLPSESFKSSGTNVETCVARMVRP